MGKLKSNPLLFLPGLYSQLTNKNEELANQRLEICKQCPLFATVLGSKICSPSKETTHKDTKESVKGCGCVLSKKVRLKDSECPAGKW